jgi:membrane fusion protein (multidrug efflux system)
LQQASAQVASAEAEAARASADVQRYQQLYERDELSRQRLDQAIAAAATANAQLAAARQRVAASQAQTAGANLEELRAQVRQAKLQLSYTKIYAPAAGRVTRKSVEEGALVQPGQPLLALVTGDLWVTANFKESQIGQIKPGQPVEIRVDAYPGKVFKGHVDVITHGFFSFS